MLMPPPIGDQAARPVSSYSTIKTLGDPSGARGSMNGAQSGFESRISSLMTPLNAGGFFNMLAPGVLRSSLRFVPSGPIARVDGGVVRITSSDCRGEGQTFCSRSDAHEKRKHAV